MSNVGQFLGAATGGFARGAQVGSQFKQQQLAQQLQVKEKEKQLLADGLKASQAHDKATRLDGSSSPRTISILEQQLDLLGVDKPQQQSTPPLPPPAPRVSRRATFRQQPGTGPRLPFQGARSPEGIEGSGDVRRQGIKADVAVAGKRRKATEQSALRKFRSLAGSRFKQLFPKKSLFDAFFAKELGADANILTFSFKNKVHGPLLLKAIEELKALGIPVSDLEIADLQLEEFRGPSSSLGEISPVTPGLSRTGTELDSALGFLPTDTVGASFTEGATATDSTGRQIILHNGQWIEIP